MLYAAAHLLFVIAVAALAARLPRNRARTGILAILMAVLLGCWIRTRPALEYALVPWSGWIFVRQLDAALLAGIVVLAVREARERRHRMARILLGTVALGLGGWEHAWYFSPPPVPGPARSDGTAVLQSSSDTCSAAAAATLFNLSGAPTSESEMVELCATRRGYGTQTIGLLRGMTLRGGSLGLRPSPEEGLKAADLPGRAPAIILVGLTDSVRLQAPDLESSWDRVSHMVVYLGPSPTRPGFHRIADPSVGCEEWPDRHLRALFRGLAIRLERER
ncbi:MAG: hypothetical protein HYY93_10700 [Planctomycetes bacterium]|nr:hypothetical protein [Planctomycetota bacterium]